MHVKTLERCFNDKIDKEMSNNVDAVEDRIQNAILAAINSIVAPEIELAIRSIHASSGRNVTIVIANSEREEHVGINAVFKNASGNNNVLHVSNVNAEIRNKIPDEVTELSVPKTSFDRQTHTHHMVTGKQPKQIKTLSSTHFNITQPNITPNIRTCQHKYHRTAIHQ